MRNRPTRLSEFLSRKISKTKIETSGIAALTFGDLIYDRIRVDQRYIDGVDFSRPSKDLSSVFKIGNQNISESPETLDVLHERNYSGYTHEFVTDQWARNRGEEVIIPEKFNQPGYDRIYNGEEFQIKFNSVDAIREHRLKYPDIKVRSDIETAEAYNQKFPEDVGVVFGTTPKVFTENLVSEGKEGSMEIFNNDELFDTGVPEILGISAIIPIIKNFSYLVNEKTDIATASQNVATDTLVVGAGMSLGSALGAVIDPIGTFVGAVGGAYIFKKTWDSLKVGIFCSEEEKNLERAIILYMRALTLKLKNNQGTLEEKAKKFKSTFGLAVYRRKVLKEENLTKELYEYIIQRMRNEYKNKKNTLILLEALDEIYRLPEATFSHVVDATKKFEILTPDEQENYSDAKLPIIGAKISQIGIKVGISPEFLEKETSRLLDAIENFVKAVQSRGL
jgi:hypothetical protein